MDPVENMREQIELAGDILADSGEFRYSDDVVRLAELVDALHEWRQAGGVDPYVAPFAGLRRF